MNDLDEEESSGLYMRPELFIKLARKEIENYTHQLVSGKATDMQNYGLLTGRIWGLQKALNIFTNKDK